MPTSSSKPPANQKNSQSPLWYLGLPPLENCCTATKILWNMWLVLRWPWVIFSICIYLFKFIHLLFHQDITRLSEEKNAWECNSGNGKKQPVEIKDRYLIFSDIQKISFPILLRGYRKTYTCRNNRPPIQEGRRWCRHPWWNRTSFRQCRCTLNDIQNHRNLHCIDRCIRDQHSLACNDILQSVSK